jgi:hypothetical protein
MGNVRLLRPWAYIYLVGEVEVHKGFEMGTVLDSYLLMCSALSLLRYLVFVAAYLENTSVRVFETRNLVLEYAIIIAQVNQEGLKFSGLACADNINIIIIQRLVHCTVLSLHQKWSFSMCLFL